MRAHLFALRTQTWVAWMRGVYFTGIGKTVSDNLEALRSFGASRVATIARWDAGVSETEGGLLVGGTGIEPVASTV